ncbi:MAG: ribonuclease domain-containing protein [Oscillospiraceae bacterium]
MRSAGRAAAWKRIRPEPPSAATASATARELLPEETGRTYTECDINTLGADSRGAERLIFSNDGLYFYTSDHYASFTELTVDGGTVIWN